MKNFFKEISKASKQQSKLLSYSEKQLSLMRDLRQSNYFRALTGKEQEAISIQDNRDLSNSNPNNNVIIVSEHSSNDVKYSKILDEEEPFLRSHEATDVGVFDLTSSISEMSKTLAVCSNFSKLIIDPAQPILSQRLVREYYREEEQSGVKIPISINHQGYRLFDRLETYYLEYHKILLDVLEFIQPNIVLNIHTHDPDLSQTDLDALIYTPEDDSKFTNEIIQSLEKLNLKTLIKKKLRQNDHQFCSPVLFENLIYYYQDKTLDGCYISLNSNKLLFEKDFRDGICDSISEVIRKQSKL
ncbi:UNKNOWN [Stylonychia lemnae]|uniref:N-formylglutamate amidohydrolase n=1 Tax=Stylonychia lemnae TaxID=5949 RepID=A0A078B849_STYLE|nr:UNKNOWN [Stylonychia lemnae]|eukprot:CDW90371.1 UNKNOWN [Stylonychia lemnae]